MSSPGLLGRTIERVRPREMAGLEGAERSRERSRRVALTAASSGFAAAVGVAVSLIAIPLTVRYLGTEQYGLWATIGSATALLGFADLGLSSGLVNAVAETHATQDERSARRYVASAFYLLVGIALVLGAVFALVYPGVSWGSLFNVSSPAAAAVAGPALAVFVVVTLAGIPVGIAPKVRSGYQEGFANGVWQSVGSVVSLATLVAVLVIGADLPWVVLALGCGALVASVLNGGALLRKRPWLAPRLRDVKRPASSRVLRLGMLFFIVQAAGVAAVSIDNIVIARILGAGAVTAYAIPMKLFLFVPLASNLVVTPMWPAYREALTRDDVGWVRQTLRRAVVGSTLWGLLASGVLVVTGGPLIRAWTGGAVDPSASLLVALGLFALFLCLGQALAVYMNAANVVAFQAVCLSLMVVVNLALSIALTHRIGVAGPAWGSAISVALLVIVPYGLFVRRSIRRLPLPGPRSGGPDMG